MVEDLLAARGIIVSHGTVRCRAETFGRIYASKIRRRAPQFGDTWHLDEVVISINGKRPCHVRAVDADGFVLDAPVQSREGRRAAQKLLRKLIRKQCCAPRVMVTDKPGSDGAARTGMGMPTPPALRLHPRWGRQPPHLSPPRHVIIWRSRASFRGDSCLARDRRTGHRRVAPGESPPSSPDRRLAS